MSFSPQKGHLKTSADIALSGEALRLAGEHTKEGVHAALHSVNLGRHQEPGLLSGADRAPWCGGQVCKQESVIQF